MALNELEGKRNITFSRELYIEADDFMEEPPKKYFRLFPGNYVRLKGAYIVKCTGCKKDENGKVVEVYAEYDPATRGGNPPEGLKVKGTIHWVNAADCVEGEVRLFDRLFDIPNPDAADVDFMQHINPHSLTRWLNAEYIRAMSEEDFHKAVLPFIQQTVKSENADTALIAKCLHQRTEVLGEIGAQIDFIDVLDDYSPDLFINKKSKSTLESSKTMLEAVIPALEALPEC